MIEVAEARWLPGDECPRCLGHGVIEIAVPITVCCGSASPHGECCGNGRDDYDFDIDGCPECHGEGTLKPIKTRAESAET